ncbi:DinB family protein [Pedobacter frigoris]|uniref:DinB family protein n=1 Tax=Pedobacter frigoris TaxID=2571272 RepID=A0A4U1CQ07_9SPHI|nr:DinB family protein [Pedobacter frigoris]TKC09624.1 DinB family protein [Pedobacter frigoris]
MGLSVYPQVETLRKLRLYVFNAVNESSAAQLNKVPSGFNNNIIWNVAHLVTAQEGVCYLRAKLPAPTGMNFFNSYKPGSRPEKDLSAEDIDHIKELLAGSLDRLESDLQQHIFTEYVPWVTRYGVEINNIEEALNFLPFHEGMHMGYIAALQRLV